MDLLIQFHILLNLTAAILFSIGIFYMLCKNNKKNIKGLKIIIVAFLISIFRMGLFFYDLYNTSVGLVVD